jgi:hypothetical protein
MTAPIEEPPVDPDTAQPDVVPSTSPEPFADPTLPDSPEQPSPL